MKRAFRRKHTAFVIIISSQSAEYIVYIIALQRIYKSFNHRWSDPVITVYKQDVLSVRMPQTLVPATPAHCYETGLSRRFLDQFQRQDEQG